MRHLIELSRSSGFIVYSYRWLTYWTVPFYYLILRVGKRTLNVDKFKWSNPPRFKGVMKVLEWVDKHNKKVMGPTSIHVAVKLTKNYK